ncbi:MAG TPA: VIT1/CCC1 transporter family protein [Armatimonadaceae bacterium]|nr:VIT1/CCC1 transporter family protein [Armatimonadaceae bacterium]
MSGNGSADPATRDPKQREEMVRVLKENWREELVVARVYHEMAAVEPSPKRKDLLRRMAESEEEHAWLWAERLAALGVMVDPTEADGEVRRQRGLVRHLGVDAMIRRIEREERGHVADYQAQIRALDDPATTAILERVIPDEEAHAERLRAMAAEGHHGPRSRLDALLSREKWHAHGTGSWIGDAIYGVNDGLGAVFGIVSAVAGATSASPRFVLIAGLAGMIGSAFSMGSSAYLAAKSEREVHEAEIDRERREIETDPEHEREELELMYQIKGFSEEEAKQMAARLTQSPEQFLSTMVAEELGLSEDRLPNPWLSALVATVSTAVGAFLPVIPFFYTSGMEAVLQSLVISIVAHFAVGASKTFITGRSWVRQGLEMTFVGMLGGMLAYGFGLLVGAHDSL